MSEFLDQGVKFGMGGGAEKVFENPIEGFPGFGSGGLEIQEVFDIAALVAVESGAELEQDESGPADEANLEVLAVFPGVEILPEAGRKKREVEAMEGGGSVEPIRRQAQFRGDLGGGLLDRLWQRIGSDDMALPLSKGHDIDVLGGSVAEALRQQRATATDDQPDGCGSSNGEKLTEEMECFVEVVHIHKRMLTRPFRMFQQYNQTMVQSSTFSVSAFRNEQVVGSNPTS